MIGVDWKTSPQETCFLSDYKTTGHVPMDTHSRGAQKGSWCWAWEECWFPKRCFTVPTSLPSNTFSLQVSQCLPRGQNENNVHGSIIYSSQKVEITHMSINWWMNKQNVLYPYNRILFSHKRQGRTDHATMCMNLENIILSERSRSRKTTHGVIPSIWNVQKRQIRRERKMSACLGLEGWKDGEWPLTSTGMGFHSGCEHN